MTAGDARRLLAVVALVLVVVVCAVIVVVVLGRKGTQPYAPAAYVFDGPSDKLALTAVVPTLDTPMPADTNVVWCASFQLAWNGFRDSVIGEPVKIADAQEFADRLNASTVTDDVLEPGDYYARAGLVQDGITWVIMQEMSREFPDVPTPEFEEVSAFTVAVAYAYVQAHVTFTLPFYENDEEFLFDAVPVSSFGIRAKDERAPAKLREQVRILYSSIDEYGVSAGEVEFAFDLCRDSTPYQIIVARVAPRATLAETLAALDEKIAGWTAPHYGDALGEQDVLLVPAMRWRVDHRFAEIEGNETDRRLLNSGHEEYWLGAARELIDFQLDRSGAGLRSEARGLGGEKSAGPNRRDFVFDRPFLVVMKKRGAAQPFFVMWVDNAELLCRP